MIHEANFAVHHVLGNFAGIPDTFLAVLLLFLSLALIFAGKSLAKALAFLVTGAVVGAIGAIFGTMFLGILGTILGGVVGFLVGGLIGIMLLELGIGVALGYFGYTVAHSYFGGITIPIVIGIALFVVGIVLADRILSVATVVLGGVLLFDVMLSLGTGAALATLVSVVVSLAGLWVQNRTEEARKNVVKPAPQVQ